MLRWLLWLVLLPVTLPISGLRALLARVRPCTLLQVELEGSLADVRTGRGFGKGTNLLTLVRALEHAARDPKLRQVHVHLEQAGLGLGQAEELRAALQRVKDGGKEVVVSSQTLGLAGYWLALGASKVVLCPTGALDVAGVASEFTLLRGLLDQVGLRARMFAKGRYKSMREMFTEEQISDENREMLRSIVDELYLLLCERVAQARRMSAEDVRSRIDQGPFRASEALRLGLIDELAYPDELEQRIEDDKSLRSLDAAAYLRRKERRFTPRRAPLVAVLEVRGTIGAGKDGVGLGGGRTTGSTSFVEQVRRAKENPRVKALLLRVSSPGGSALGSDLMWRALDLAKEKKPMVVSMGDVAASGGYYVSGLAGVTILANPTTLTGSIGVVAGKWEAVGLMHKLGVRRELIHAGRHAGYYSPSVEWGPEEEAKLMHDVDALYHDFVQKMAMARGTQFEQFEQLARGRVWTGSQAIQNGLVDSAGGLLEATIHLKRALNLADHAQLRFVSMGRGGMLRAFLERINMRTRGFGLGGLSELSAEFGSQPVGGRGLMDLMRLRLPFDIRFK